MDEKMSVTIERNPAAYVEPGSLAELNHNFDYNQRKAVWDVLSRIEPNWSAQDTQSKNRMLYLELRDILAGARAAHKKEVKEAGGDATLFEFMKSFLPKYLKDAEAAAREKGRTEPTEEEFPDFAAWEDKNRDMLQSLQAGAKERQMLWELAKAKANIGKK